MTCLMEEAEQIKKKQQLRDDFLRALNVQHAKVTNALQMLDRGDVQTLLAGCGVPNIPGKSIVDALTASKVPGDDRAWLEAKGVAIQFRASLAQD